MTHKTPSSEIERARQYKKENEKLQNNEFKVQCDDTEAEYHFIRSLIKARNETGLTQR
jgi:hypothetical protein